MTKHGALRAQGYVLHGGERHSATRRITRHLRGGPRRCLPVCPWRCRTSLRSGWRRVLGSRGWLTPPLGAPKGHDLRTTTTATDAPGPTPPGTRHGGCVPQQSARAAQASLLASATPCCCFCHPQGPPESKDWIPRQALAATASGPRGKPQETRRGGCARFARIAPCARSPSGSSAPSPPLDVGTREGEGKGRAVSLDTLYRNLARMRGENLPHNREASPCPCRFGRVERLANMGQLRDRDAAAGIASSALWLRVSITRRRVFACNTAYPRCVSRSRWSVT